MNRWTMLGAAGIFGALVLAAACSSEEPADESPAASAPAQQGAVSLPAVDAGVFAVDAAASEVYWRIYRAGLMARLGHNHVISVGELDGTVNLAADPAASSWSLSFPANGLIVDDPAIRARYGEDFSSEPSEEDIAGTKRNMLSEGVLNGEAYPDISLSGTGINGTLADAELPATLELLGQSIELTLPASIVIDGDTLTVSGEFQLTHEALGMSPFTALGGAMAVGEEIDFTYTIVAVAGGD